jgi:phosphoglycolate phosphatase-like HAD superfamily hydrolase
VTEKNQMQPEAIRSAPNGVQRIERLGGSLRRPLISHAIFDFDGTLSWLRHGWPGIMLDGFLEHGPLSWREDDTIRRDLLADILSLNGKPTIHQMRSFSERLQRTTGKTAPPEMLLAEYEGRLRRAIDERSAAIQQGVAREQFVVWGVRRILELLRDRGVVLIILSGTVETEVRAEAALLELAHFFGAHIYGSIRGSAFSKNDVILRILRDEKIQGYHLVSFGDGPVEIQFTKAAGGLAIGVASDEEINGSHRSDPFKREQLARAGADAIIPDYAEADALVEELFGKTTMP